MGTTTHFSFPYPELSDSPDGPSQIGDLADAVDTALQALTTATTGALGSATSYTPTIANGGSVTWTTRTGYYYQIGKIVFVVAYAIVNAAGSGTTDITVSLPVTADTSTRQTLNLDTTGMKGDVAVGQAIISSGGAGTTLSHLHVGRTDGAAQAAPAIQGNDLNNASVLTIQGWYRAA